jgi:putative SOS response-associated peptidase YedK
MCNLYSMTKSQAAIREWIRAMRDTTGNLPPMPGIFPDMMAPVVRTGSDGERELVMARWGMPSPPQFVTGIDRGVTNIRNVASPHWRGWLKPENRCLVPATSFCEYAGTTPKVPGSRLAMTVRYSPSPGSGAAGTARAAQRRTRLMASTPCSAS